MTSAVIIVGPDDDDGPSAEVPAAPAAPTPAPPPVPAAPAVVDHAAKVTELEGVIAKLSRSVTRNNGELAKRRSVAKMMEQLGIDNLGEWLTQRGIDPATGQRLALSAPVDEPAGDGPDDQPEDELEPGEEGDPDDEPEELDDEGEGDEPDEAGTSGEPHPETVRAEKLAYALRRTAVAGALKDRGFSGTLDRALKVLEADGTLDTLEIDADGEVIGAVEAAQSLNEEIPEWFARKRQPAAPAPPPRVGVDAGERRPPRPAPRRWDQRVDDRLSGR